MLRSGIDSFYGSQTNKIDAKGRVAAPADFRKKLDLVQFNGFYCTPSVDGPYLECGGLDYIENIKAIISALPPYDAGRRALERQILGKVKELSIDNDGRFVLPKKLRDHAGIEDKAHFVGVGDTFQIWKGPETDEDEADEVALARETLTRLQNAHRQAPLSGSASSTSGAGGAEGAA